METATIDTATDSRPTRGRHSLAKSLGVICFCLLLSGIATVPYFFMGEPDEEQDQTRWSLRMPDTHDIFLHYDQMKSFYTGLRAGEIYPRWEVETNRGFGAPTTCFYPPAIYYVTSLFYYAGRNWVLSLLWTHLAIMVASAAAIYLYARRTLSRAAAVVAMTCYTILPYHLIDQYQRGALAELLGFVWMPLILLFLEQLFDAPSFRSSPGDQTSREATTGQSPLSPDRSWRRSFVRGSMAVTGLAIAYA